MTERMDELMEKAAKVFQDCANPFDLPFLSDNDVLSHECIDLSHMVASACRLYVRTPKKARDLIVAANILQDFQDVKLPVVGDVLQARVAAEIANEYLTIASTALRKFSQEEIKKLPLVTESLLNLMNSLEDNVQFFKSCIRLRFLTQMVKEADTK